MEHEPRGSISPAEHLPALYRAVLDVVAELERRGERLDAHRFRSEAIRSYSRSWDAAGRRRLESILRRGERLLAVIPPSVPDPVPELVPDASQASTDAVTQRVATTV